MIRSNSLQSHYGADNTYTLLRKKIFGLSFSKEETLEKSMQDLRIEAILLRNMFSVLNPQKNLEEDVYNKRGTV